MDFTDLALLGARDSADAEKRTMILATVRSYVLAFFDQYLKGVNSDLLNQTAPPNEFLDTVQKFEPARFPCPTN
jgi:hypothetical protein